MADRLIDRIWWGSDFASTLLRTALSPLGAAYLAGSDLRNRAFDSGRFRTGRAAIPVVSVGNLTVGGTGKTPVSAWVANELARRGARPAIVMRGYGEDEVLVHRVLTPNTPVVVSPARLAGIARAKSEFGCDVAILDDGFQHRWAERLVDIVLLGAEETTRPQRGLPAGPWRESMASVSRATIAVVTRKSASAAEADRVIEMLRKVAPALPVAVVRLATQDLVSHTRNGSATVEIRAPITELAGARVLVVAAIANARSFVEQIRASAGPVTEAIYEDHHAFSVAEAESLASRARIVDRVICTLKDFVKLSPLWPRNAPPLWYVSQQVIIERGADAIDRQLAILLDARTD